jgi:predicted RNA methylase
VSFAILREFTFNEIQVMQKKERKTNSTPKSNTKNPTKFLISYPFGLQKYIDDMLQYELKNCEMVEKHDTFAVFLTSSNSTKVGKLPFASNVYIYIKKFTHQNVVAPAKQLQWAIKKSTIIEKLQKIPLEFHNYRLMSQKQGSTNSLPKDNKKVLSAKLRCYLNVKVSHTSPEVEIWFIQVNDNLGFCGLKINSELQSNKRQRNKLQKGELRPEIAYFLNFLAVADDLNKCCKRDRVAFGKQISCNNQKSSDDKANSDIQRDVCTRQAIVPSDYQGAVFWDPFAGSGALPFSAAKFFDYDKIVASDIDLANLKENYEDLPCNIQEKVLCLQMDVGNLSRIPDCSICRVVTDPPWGIYNPEVDIYQLYETFLTQLAKKMCVSSIVVLLIKKKYLSLIRSLETYNVSEIIDISIWGQKAKIVKLTFQKD